MIVVTNLAAAAVTAVLAISSGRNMFQTITVGRQNAAAAAGGGSSSSGRIFFEPNESTEDVIAKAKSMKRKELLQLYFDSRGPTNLDEIQGEWDGCLLDNQSWIMTAVTALLTDRLFGMGRRWNGKQFGTGPPTQGINRFYPRQSSSSSSGTTTPAADTQHNFDMRIQNSKLGKKDTSLVLDYTNYQFPLSLWRTMMDEIRIVELDRNYGSDDDGDGSTTTQPPPPPRVLIGLGYMAWSGGRWNSSPFLLYRKDSK